MNKYERAIQEELQWIKEELQIIENYLSSDISPQIRIALEIKSNYLHDEFYRLQTRID